MLEHLRLGEVKQWLAVRNLVGMEDCRYVDIGALWSFREPGAGETISVASNFTRDLHIIDITSELWPAVQQRLESRGITCEFHPGNVLDYEGEPFDAAACMGVIYHFRDPEHLWNKLDTIVTRRLLIQSICVPPEMLPEGRLRMPLAEIEGRLRGAIATHWDRQCNRGWIRPQSEEAQNAPYAAMQHVYTHKALIRDARQHGWLVREDIVWHEGLEVALLLEK